MTPNAPSFALLETVTLLSGGHTSPEEGVCAMEALALAMGLPHSAVPTCTDAPLARAFQRVNDWPRWESDEARTAFLRPYLMRLGRLAVAGKRAPLAAYGFASADIACRVFAPLALDAILPDPAAKLRGLPPVMDRETADAARAAADAAYATPYAAAADADYAAFYAAYVTYATADAAYEDLAGQLLTRLLDVCEAGRWPLTASKEA